MKPYFDTNHLAGPLLLIVTMAWGAMELSQRSQGLGARKGATKVGGATSRVVFWTCLIAASAFLYLAPRLVPEAAIRPGAVAFTAGMVILIAGLVLRGWSFKALGEYFTHTVMVSSDQPVITTGPYRLLRHPGYTGFLLACAGVGLASANGAGWPPWPCCRWRSSSGASTSRRTRCWQRSATSTTFTPPTISASSRSSGDQDNDRNRLGRGALIREVAREVHVPEPGVLVPSTASGRLRRVRGSGPR